MTKERHCGKKEMLVCLKCNIEYEDGKESCSKCGNPLMAKEKPVSDDKEKNKSKNRKPDEKLICPSCRLLYEKMTICIRCGATLVKEIPSQQGEEPKPSTPQVEKEELRTALSPGVKKENLRASSSSEATKKSLEPAHSPEGKKEPFQVPTPGKRPIGKLPEDTGKGASPPVKSKKKFLRLLFEGLSVCILVAIGIYFFWLIYSHFATKRAEPNTPSPKETTGLILHDTSSSTNVTPTLAEPQEEEKKPPAPSSLVNEPEEIEGIKGLLEKIRQANIQKNIDLFMSCYSNDFKGREDKKKATLETWGNYNYLDLSYTLKDYSISGPTAQAKVEWLFKFYLKEGSPTKESKTVLNVRFKKEDGSWKIKETKTAS